MLLDVQHRRERLRAPWNLEALTGQLVLLADRVLVQHARQARDAPRRVTDDLLRRRAPAHDVLEGTNLHDQIGEGCRHRVTSSARVGPANTPLSWSVAISRALRLSMSARTSSVSSPRIGARRTALRA